jgi:O-antigen biosynthesis protein WbqP
VIDLLKIVAASLMLVILSPILFCVAVIIILDDGFPVIFKQKRIGINNSLFYIYKFRTMKKNVNDIPTHLVEHPTALYTRSGKYLRILSLDELPQLLNIIKGDMGFIGPRPALYNQADLIDYRNQKGVDTLLPGITGWAQVNGRDELSINQKVDYDYYYLANKTVYLDIKILAMTVIKIIKIDNISH